VPVLASRPLAAREPATLPLAAAASRTVWPRASTGFGRLRGLCGFNDSSRFQSEASSSKGVRAPAGLPSKRRPPFERHSWL
jgi:hypothetical protein